MSRRLPSPEVRALVASIGADESWARTADRTARTAPARQAFRDRFLDRVDPAITDPATRAKAAESLRRAYYKRLALKSAIARKAKRSGGAAA